MEQRLISFDIWDTVLRRRCAPDEDKLAVAKYLLLYYYNNLKDEYKTLFSIDHQRKNIELEIAKINRQSGYDDEYTIEDVFYRLLNKIFINKIVENKLLIEKLIEIELRHEIRITYLEKDVLKIANQYRKDRIIYISDFYMNKSLVDKILDSYSNEISFENGYVSCDYLYNKKSGRLYELVEKDNCVTPKNHIHYGDNMLADVNAAKELGIDAKIFLPEKNHNKKKELENMFYSRKDGNLQKYFDFLERIDKNNNGSELFKKGQRYSIIFYCFVLEIIESAIKRKVKKVYYFTREGEFFEKIHKSIQKHCSFGFSLPDCEILEVSRMATFAPSLWGFSIDEMRRIWTQYHDQSMKSFYKSLNIPLEPYIEYFKKHGIKEDEKIPNITEDKRIVELFEDKDYINKMKIETAKKRRSLKGYLKQKGIDEESKEIFIVDIGWRGSIQDNIALILPDTHFYGYYFGLFESFYGEIKNSEKKGFLNYNDFADYMWCLRFVDPIEMYCNSCSGSTVGYKEYNGIYCAVKENFYSEDFVFSKYISDFQNGVLFMIPVLSDIINTFSIVSDELKETALKFLEMFIGAPDKVLAEPYFSLSHNENFGKGAVEEKKAKFNYLLAIKAAFTKKWLNQFVSDVEKSHWPQGLFSVHGLNFLNSIYNKKVKEHISKMFFLEKEQWCELIGDYFEIQNSAKIRFFIEKQLVRAKSVELGGWAVLPGVSSKNMMIYVILENEKQKYLFNTKVVIRKDVTNHFNDGINYDDSGFVCKMDRNLLEHGDYKAFIILKKGDNQGFKILVKESINII